MSDYLPKELRLEMDEARKRTLKRRSRLNVQVDGNTYRILRITEDGFTLDANDVAHLRGLVDIYDGPRHLSQSLIVASGVEAGELVCQVKWSTPAADRPALDYVRADDAPTGYLTFHHPY